MSEAFDFYKSNGVILDFLLGGVSNMPEVLDIVPTSGALVGN